tara:strand:- start:232 stop:735 length:504 start_codon:yes stop_codon:yes gene_type:complete
MVFTIITILIIGLVLLGLFNDNKTNPDDKFIEDIQKVNFDDAESILNFGRNQSNNQGLNKVQDNEIIGGFGIYGFDKTNPIPLMSIPESYGWLANLTTLEDKEISNERIGSFSVSNIKNSIDGYKISAQGAELATIYISAYSNSNSIKPPEGFKLCGLTQEMLKLLN